VSLQTVLLRFDYHGFF